MACRTVRTECHCRLRLQSCHEDDCKESEWQDASVDYRGGEDGRDGIPVKPGDQSCSSGVQSSIRYEAVG